MHDDEIASDPALVRRLLADAGSPWADRPIVELASAGSDHRLFRLGPDRLARLPRRPSAAAQSAKQRHWLPRLAPGLPLQVPRVCAAFEPGPPFPWPWLVVDWIEGRAADLGQLEAVADAPTRIADFVLALRGQDSAAGPAPGEHNAWRGVPLPDWDASVRPNLAQLADIAPLEQTLAVWEQALAAAPAAAGQWLHGDLTPGNLLLSSGQLQAVIDFGLLGVGDAACDLMAGWTLFGPRGRARFFDAVRPDADALARGRGWALAFAAVALPYYRPPRFKQSHPLATVAQHTLQELMRPE